MHTSAKVVAGKIISQLTKTTDLLAGEIERCCQELKLEAPPELAYAVCPDYSFRIGLASGTLYIPNDFKNHHVFLLAYVSGESQTKILQKWSRLGAHKGFDEKGVNLWEEVEEEIPENTAQFLNHLLMTSPGFEMDLRQAGGLSPKDEECVKNILNYVPCFGYIKFAPFSIVK